MVAEGSSKGRYVAAVRNVSTPSDISAIHYISGSRNITAPEDVARVRHIPAISNGPNSSILNVATANDIAMTSIPDVSTINDIPTAGDIPAISDDPGSRSGSLIAPCSIARGLREIERVKRSHGPQARMECSGVVKGEWH